MEKYSSLRQPSRNSLESNVEETNLFLPSHVLSSPEADSSRLLRRIHLGILYLIIVIFSIIFLYENQRLGSRIEDPSIGIFSPAEDVVSYKIVTFGKYFGFDNRSPYTQSPSPELEAMWEDLYNEGISGIKPEEAAKLHEPTTHLPWDNETYVISLAVFHQLHCVNHLRKVLYPDEYPELWEYNEDGSVKRDAITSLHSDHCIDIIRQTIMCHGDITPMPFLKKAGTDDIFPPLASTHVCRDFDAILNWAKERNLKHLQVVGLEESGK